METNNKTEDQNAVSGVIADESIFSGADDVDKETLVEMAKVGILYGHKKSRKDPKFSGYIFTSRGGVEILDLTKTLKAVSIVSGFLKTALAEKKNFLVVATQPAAKEAALKLSQALGNCSYIANKWIGGLITNFPVIFKRLEYFRKRDNDMREGKFSAYTKKEQLLISREIEKMRIMFSGLENFSRIPDVIFVVDSSLKGHRTAVHEALLKGITVVGIIDNDDDPSEFDYFVPANDHAKGSIDWVVGKLIDGLN